MSIEENKAVMQRIWKEILSEGKIEKANVKRSTLAPS